MRESFEGKLLLAGLAISILYALILGIIRIFDAETGYHLSAMTVYHIFLGRAVGISYGYTVEMGLTTVIVSNRVIETALLTILFPLFVLSLKWRMCAISTSLPIIPPSPGSGVAGQTSYLPTFHGIVVNLEFFA